MSEQTPTLSNYFDQSTSSVFDQLTDSRQDEVESTQPLTSNQEAFHNTGQTPANCQTAPALLASNQQQTTNSSVNPGFHTSSPIIPQHQSLIDQQHFLASVSPVSIDSVNTHPVTPREDPTLLPGQPVLTTAQPVLTTAQPVLTTAQPVLTTAQPVLTTTQPVLTTTQPVLNPVQDGGSLLPPSSTNTPLIPSNPSTNLFLDSSPSATPNLLAESETQILPTPPAAAAAAPGQSAMMMSMTTSMLDTSPNASMDVEGTTVKFQQSAIQEEDESVIQTFTNPTPSFGSANPSSQTLVTNTSHTIMSAGNVALGIVAITTPPTSKKSISSSPKPPIHLDQPSADKKNDHKTFKFFANPMANPFEASPAPSHDSAMINPVYMSPTDSFNISNAIPSPDSFLTPATEQDVFTASLLSSDADRRHDAWIPSDTTKQALKAMLTSPPGTYFPEKDLLTMPGIAVKEDFGDPVKNLVRSYLGEEAAAKRIVLTAASVTQDDRGLRQLIAGGCYHAAVNLTTQLLTVYGQGEGRAGHPSKHTAHSIQLWFTRVALLIKLRRFSLAEVECQYFGDLDAPDLYFEFYPELYGGRRGSMVPFGFRLLVAELPQYLGKHTQALDKLNALLKTCTQIIDNLSGGLSEDGSSLEMSSNMRDDSLKLWRTRRLKVLYSITNCAVSLKDFRLAGTLLERLINEDPNSAAGLYSALGRLCLQLGDFTAAQETFNHYLEHTPPPPHHDPVQGLLHSAYISIAQNAYKDAVDILQQAHKINPNNGLVINNLGVCLMYTGRVTDAIKMVEAAVFSQPERFLHEATVLNLATMYELESSNAHQNKLKLLGLIAQHKGDSFNVAALKLQPQ